VIIGDVGIFQLQSRGRLVAEDVLLEQVPRSHAKLARYRQLASPDPIAKLSRQCLPVDPVGRADHEGCDTVPLCYGYYAQWFTAVGGEHRHNQGWGTFVDGMKLGVLLVSHLSLASAAYGSLLTNRHEVIEADSLRMLLGVRPTCAAAVDEGGSLGDDPAQQPASAIEARRGASVASKPGRELVAFGPAEVIEWAAVLGFCRRKLLIRFHIAYFMHFFD